MDNNKCPLLSNHHYPSMEIGASDQHRFFNQERICLMRLDKYNPEDNTVHLTIMGVTLSRDLETFITRLSSF